MKKALLCVLALLLVQAVPAFAQDLAGQWQGTLQAQGPNGPVSLRVVIRITRPDGGAMQGLFYSIDQNSPGLPVGGITVQGSTVRFTVPAINGTYQGQFGAEGAAIVGTFSQGATPIALNLARATPQNAWALPTAPAAPKPLAADAPLVFDVATIKPTAPGTQGKLFTIRGRAFTTLNTSFADLITFAYGLHPRQITNGPEWLEKEMYDITATPQAEGVPTVDQAKVMLQKLLADRFKLAFHHDTRELAVYALVVARSGSKLTKNDTSPNGPPGLIFQGLGALPARNATMREFANVMQSAVMDRPVVDQTGLSGRWDFVLRWTPDESQFRGLGVRVPAPKDDPAAPPDLFTALQEQLGLRMEPTRAPVDVIVVDAADHPTDN